MTTNPHITDAAQVLILEDDVTPFDTSERRAMREYSRQWARVWHTTSRELSWLGTVGERWELLYLGRHRLGADEARFLHGTLTS